MNFPKPELYVLYPKERGDLPDEITLSKDVWEIDDPDQIFVDVKAKIIFGGQKGDIIDQYIIFSRVFDEQIKLHGKTEKAVLETIRICKDQNVLREYLVKEEVLEIMFAYLDKEQQAEYIYKQGREEGREEGRILESVNMYRELTDWSDKQIIQALMKKFNLSPELAEQYVMTAFPA